MPAAKKPSLKPSPILILIGFLVLVILGSYLFIILKSNPPIKPPSKSIQSVNPVGTYKGELPCADCPGITETLIISASGAYLLEDLYQERSKTPIQTQGKWEIVNSNILKLTPVNNSQSSYFQVLENGDLKMLDTNMQTIDSPFNQTLTKQ